MTKSGLTVSVIESSIERGEPIAIDVAGTKPVQNACSAQIDILFGDRISGGFQAQGSAGLSADGSARITFDSDGWPQDSVFTVSALRLLGADGRIVRERSFEEGRHTFEIHEPGEPRLTRDEIDAKSRQLKQAQDAFHKQPLGDPKAPGVVRWQAVVLVEYLLIGSWLSLPGVDIHPAGVGNPAESEARIFDEIMSKLLPGFRPVAQSEWAKRSESNRPISILQFENVYAPSIEVAGALVARRRDQVLDLLALNRRTAARVIGSVFTAAGLTAQLQVGSPSYTGNLATGFLAGESVHALVRQDEAAQADSVLALALTLLRDAHGEQNPNFAYFRFWAVLEMLADHRVKRGEPVTLLDGTPLLGKNGEQRNTRDAAPRVYEYLSQLFRGRPINVESVIAPAKDLWEAVEAWYVRRNATAHHGAFKPTTDRKIPPDSAARKTEVSDPNTERDEWLARLRDLVTMALTAELSREQPTALG